VKPRLESAPLSSKEDLDVWFWVARKFSDANGFSARAWNTLATTIRDGDERDAELMFHAQKKRIGHWGWILQYTEHAPDCYRYVNFGGALLSASEICPEAAGNITFFA
jgi:hypothetical protein